MKKRKRSHHSYSAMAAIPRISLWSPKPERALVINLSARLRAFYTALAEIEGKRRGCFLTAEDIIREMRDGR
jgi:hypothetical protein